MLYQCSGYSRLVCRGCPVGEKHKRTNTECSEGHYCSTIHEEVHCEPVEEENCMKSDCSYCAGGIGDKCLAAIDGKEGG